VPNPRVIYFKDNGKYTGTIQLSQDNSVEFDQVTTYSPSGMKLVNALSFKVPQGKRLLIMGSSGSGKTSQLRALANLWPFFDGTIRAPYSNSKVDFMYLPQSAYLPYGTLADQIVYPLQLNDVDSTRLSIDNITKILRLVDLERLLQPALCVIAKLFNLWPPPPFGLIICIHIIICVG